LSGSKGGPKNLERSPKPTFVPRRGGSTRRILIVGGLATVVLAGLVAVFILTGGPSGRGRHEDREASLSSLLSPSAAQGFNLLLVTLDTVRSDHLGCYGYATAETPAIDGLADQGLLFENAVTPVPLTLPSHATMLTGLYPPHHGARDNGIYIVAADQETMAETLKERGYETAAFVSCFVLAPRFGLDQGFNTYDFRTTRMPWQSPATPTTRRHAADVTDAAISWLHGHAARNAAAPFFLWVHYFDAHVPYDSPNSRLERYANRLYDGEIAYVDGEFRRLIAELEAGGLREKTLIALVSDHGEGLGEHGETTHGTFIYGSTMRVAFLLSCPGLFDGSYRSRDLVSLVDLRPTLEDLLGMAVPDGLDGISLVRENPKTDRTVYLETVQPYHAARCSPLYGLQSGADKYIHGPEPEYYDLQQDPGELANRLDPAAPRVVALGEQLQTQLQAFGIDGPPGSATRVLSGREAEQLASLGYVQVAAGTSRTLPDPKAMVRADQRIKQAFQLLRESRPLEALAANRAAVKECPTFTDAWLQQSMIYEKMGKADDAIRALQSLLKLRESSEVELQLARLFVLQRRFDEMEACLQQVVALEPNNGLVHVTRGDRYVLEGRLTEAVAEYEEALRRDEIRTGAVVRPQLQRLQQMMKSGQVGSSR
jgi:choline-sulfatase